MRDIPFLGADNTGLALDAETDQGAWNRVHSACVEHPDADFWVGIEGGVEEK